MCRFDDFDELILRAVFGGDGATLIFVSKVKGVENVITNREDAAALGGRRQSKTGVAGFGNFGHFVDKVVPVHLEQFEHCFGSGIRDRL